MAHRYFTGSGSAQGTAQIIIDGVQREGISNALVDSCVQEKNGVTVVLLVFERYYYRAQNRASLSVMIISDSEANVTIDAVGSGGGQGVFFSFSWGAEDNFVRILERVLINHGFSARE